MAVITGNPGDDELTGTEFDDVFQLASVSDFVAHGLGGNDRFVFRGAFTANDEVNGGAGRDTVALEGNYTGLNALVLAADTLVGVESIGLRGGHSYDLTTNDANIVNGQTLPLRVD